MADKCVRVYGSVIDVDGNVTLANGHRYIVQEEWSLRDQACVLSLCEPRPWGVSYCAPARDTLGQHGSRQGCRAVNLDSRGYLDGGYTWPTPRPRCDEARRTAFQSSIVPR